MNQVLYILGALVILALTSLSTASFWTTKQEAEYHTEADLTANDVAQSVLEEIVVKRFDQKVVPPATTKDSSKFTSPDSLGVDSGEDAANAATFNDLDDYNHFTRIVATPRIGRFAVTCRTYYVMPSSPNEASNAKSFLKRVDIRVTNPYLSSADSSLTVSRVFAYHNN